MQFMCSFIFMLFVFSHRYRLQYMYSYYMYSYYKCKVSDNSYANYPGGLDRARRGWRIAQAFPTCWMRACSRSSPNWGWGTCSPPKARTEEQRGGKSCANYLLLCVFNQIWKMQSNTWIGYINCLQFMFNYNYCITGIHVEHFPTWL